VQRRRRADDRVPRERQFLLGREDPRRDPACLRLELGDDQLELPHLRGDRDQRLRPDLSRAAE
jgi:hypothetical protein